MTKKILSVLLCVCMALSCVPMFGMLSFASSESDGPHFGLVSKKDSGYVVVALVGYNCTGLSTLSATITFDPNVLRIYDPDDDFAYGADVENMSNVENNYIRVMWDTNDVGNGTIRFSMVCASPLSPEYLRAKPGKTVNIDPNAFEFLVIYFTQINDKANPVIKVEGDIEGCTLQIGSEQQVSSPVLNADNAKESGEFVFCAPEMNAQTLLSLAGEGSKITKTDDTALKADEMVGSGMKLTKPDGTQKTIVIKGDTNGDGKITAADARLALRRAVGLETYAEGSAKFLACDVDGNGKVTAADARKILRAAVGLEKLQ